MTDIIARIKFDVADYSVQLDTFYSTARNLGEVIDRLGSIICGTPVQSELHVCTPEPGSVKAIFKVTLAGAMLLGAGLETEMGRGLVEGLTGHEPRFWMEQLGDNLRKSADSATHVEIQDLSNIVLLYTSYAYLSASSSTLSKLDRVIGHENKLKIARNSFFRSAQADLRVKSIAFGEGGDFSVSRNLFMQQIIPEPIELDGDEKDWKFAKVNLMVTSPNWMKGDKHRKWKGFDDTGRVRWFTIFDPDFWDRLSSGLIETGTNDRVVAQMAFWGNGDRVKHAILLKVIKYNGLDVSAAAGDRELNQLLLKAIGDPAQPNFL